MVSIGQALKRFWLRQGISLLPGASESELVAFEAKHSVRLPEDLRDYLATVNGFDGSEHWMTDDEVITFLGLGDMKPLNDYWSPAITGGDSYFVFADYSIAAHVFAIRLSKASVSKNDVVVVYDDRPLEVADSFSKFVEGYLSKAESVLFPPPQA